MPNFRPMTREERIETIAKVCHAANAAWSEAHGEESLLWEQVRDSGCDGVRVALDSHTPEALHEFWCEFKRLDGWQYGPVKDAERKTHPCLVPYHELPEYQRAKDRLFSAIVDALAPALDLR